MKKWEGVPKNSEAYNTAMYGKRIKPIKVHSKEYDDNYLEGYDRTFGKKCTCNSCVIGDYINCRGGADGRTNERDLL